MKEHPILFCGDMVRAILAGNKSQARRVAKLIDGKLVLERARHYVACAGLVDGVGAVWSPYGGAPKEPLPAEHLEAACPYGAPGDRLWVRETWQWDTLTKSPLYRADYGPDELQGQWKPSIHMPRWASRLWLEVTSVRVERVQEISEEDAKAEGVLERGTTERHRAGGTVYYSGFADLWDSIKDKRGFGWDVNPWVWVVGFTMLEAGK